MLDSPVRLQPKHLRPDYLSSSGSRGTRTHNGLTRSCFQDSVLIRPGDFRNTYRANVIGDWSLNVGHSLQVPHRSFDLLPAVRETADLASSRMRRALVCR